MPKSKKRNKRKHKRKYGQQDKIVYERVVHKKPKEKKTIREKMALLREMQERGRESTERVKHIQETLTLPGMTVSDYLQYLEKKKEEAREKGVYLRYQTQKEAERREERR